MHFEFVPETWRDLFVVIGTAAGALVGLLFVVMSLHLDKVVERDDANIRVTIEGSHNNTLHLLTVLVETSLVLTPQPFYLLGAELIALNLYGLRLPFGIIRKYIGQGLTISEQGGFPTRLIATIIAAYLLGAAGGVTLVMMQAWGLYLVAASCLIKIVRTVLTAWMLMFGLIQSQAAKQ